MRDTASTLEFKPLTDTVGAEILGFDPSDITDADRKALREAWLQYHVLVLREKPLSEEAEMEFAEAFGPILRGPDRSGFVSPLATHPEIMVVSNIRKDGVPQGVLPDGEMQWHFDGLYTETPFAGAILHGIEVPSAGGETRFKNMCAVYESLPEALRLRLDGFTVVHVYNYKDTTRASLTRDESTMHAVHPLVRVHEVSGKKALYLSRLMTERIIELEEHESAELLGMLFDYVDAFPSFYEHAWKRGDSVIWDNRAVAHSRNDFPASERRLLKRVTLVS